MLAQEIARLLLEKQAVRIEPTNPFAWVSGIRAPIYCDNRLLISYPEAVEKIVSGFKQIIEEQKLEFDVIGGTATAGIPWAAFLAHELKKPMVYVRPEPKGHGAGKQVEGTMEKGARVLIVEDLISTGGSSIKSAQACEKEYDAKIVGLLAIFTYEFEKATKAFTEVKIPFWTLSNFTTLVGELTVSEEQKKAVLEFSKNPAQWWEKQE